jgi:predicted RNase H-like HicB family nuclease
VSKKPRNQQEENVPVAIIHAEGNIKRTRYVEAAMKNALYEVLEDDGSIYGEIPGFSGVYANGVSHQECSRELADVLDEWLQLRLAWGREIPIVDGIDLNQE